MYSAIKLHACVIYTRAVHTKQARAPAAAAALDVFTAAPADKKWTVTVAIQ